MAAVDKIEVDVTVEIAETALPLGRLLTLSRGAFVPISAGLDNGHDGTLDLCANGQKVGEVRVVLDGDSVNVRIAG